MNTKKLLGQFYTTKNPFVGSAFSLWNKARPHNVKTLEPFAGAGNLFSFLDEEWAGYDISPAHPSVIKQDTIKDFPSSYKVAITNPPYLAKNSARRMKMDVNIKYSDLYLDCLEIMLDNCEWVAAIIPSTFYTQKKFKKRLMAWDKLDYEMFSDTDNPAGVAYFGPDKYETKLFVNGKEIEQRFLSCKAKLQFNVPYGNYVLCGIDKTSGENIHIKPLDDTFDKEKYLKHTSRHHVLFYSAEGLDCEKINEFITEWRRLTKDFYLTSFKSIMSSGKYRKRMGFDLLSRIVGSSLSTHKGGKNEG